MHSLVYLKGGANTSNITMSKKWYNSKTIQFAFLTGAIGISTAFATEFPEMGWLITLIGVLNGLLRLVTKDPIE